ncbi:hypothetical protein LguiB_030980 [Lonicera macranthoides]
MLVEEGKESWFLYLCGKKRKQVVANNSFLAGNMHTPPLLLLSDRQIEQNRTEQNGLLC